MNLTNNLPTAAGNTSILFPGFHVTIDGRCGGPADAGGGAWRHGDLHVHRHPSPGTRAYYSGTQGDLQVEMGLYGAIIVLPAAIPGRLHVGTAMPPTLDGARRPGMKPISVWRAAAYNHPGACYDREYLFQFSEMDPNIHKQAWRKYRPPAGCTAGAAGMQSPGPDRALPSRLLPDQRTLHARLTWTPTMRRNIRTSPTTAIPTCIQEK